MIVPPDLEAYAEAHTTRADPALEALAGRTRATLPLSQMLNGAVEGRLLETIVFLQQPRLVVEIGTYSGYSALTMARALPAGGRLVTLEVSEEHAAFAERHLAAEPRIELVRGPALHSLAALDGPFDLVFIDADKTGYLDYYEAVVPKLAERGLIVADNTLRSGRVLAPEDEGDRAIVAFNEHVAADPRTVQVLLTVRDGVTLVRRAAARP
jgi:caffeoyl-CoA O-methyltransferase